MLPRHFASLVFLLAFSHLSHAASILDDGFRDYRIKGASAALRTWGYKSNLLNNPETQPKYATLMDFDKLLGACLSHENFQEIPLGSGSRLVRISARFEKGSLFFSFLVFTDKLGEETINVLRWSADPEEVWPEYSLSHLKPAPRD